MKTMPACRDLFIVLVLLLCTFGQGRSQPCTRDSIKVAQRATGERSHGVPVYEVEISNGCICPQSTVLLRCRGFSTALTVDAAVFLPLPPAETGGVHGLCVVNGFRPIFPGLPIKFQYARASPVDLTVDSCKVNCS
ncbi:unnamed protein product [Spirodela intermedia]|uniref:Uncharacterized protein n=1 Tax=Spirodela intermedia TaxID=51605 RepID=A0A7I8JAZ7_SPIIN|nr:unnamed protein product [Spirodela intermedia]CAA6667151.1 unnamed protein product [Spirodela intermedia]